MASLGVVFDIDELESGYGYGHAAYRIVFAAVAPGDLAGCQLSDGDTSTKEYCIAIESSDPARLARIREAVACSKAPGLRPLGVRFLSSIEVERAPLVSAARVGEKGTLVDCTTPWIDRAWTDAARDRREAREASVPPKQSLDAASSGGEASDASDAATLDQSAPTEERPSPEDLTTAVFPRDRKPIHGGGERTGGTLGGKYRILAVHRGGMGEVFIVENLESLRRGFELRLALKTFQDRYLRNEEAVRRFEREALQWIHLDAHPNIVDALLVERLEGKPYIWLEFVDGESLADRLERGPVEAAEAVDLALQFSRGMSHAWERHGLIHRDIKPANTMITREGVLKITDFGLSRLRASLATEAGEGLELGSPSSGDPTPVFESEGRVCGTPAYMAPEAIDDPSKIDTRTDIYSFGVMFHEMLTGQPLFQGANIYALIAHHLHTRPPDPSRVNPSIPVELDGIVLRCLEKSPEDRFSTFAELERVLAELGPRLAGWRPATIPDRPRAGPRGKAFMRAIGLMPFGRYEEALAAFERSLDGTAGDGEEIAVDARRWLAETFNNMAVCLLWLGRLTEAESYASRAVRLRPDYAEAWSNLGGIYGSLGRYDEGVTACERAIELKAEWAEAHANRGANLTGLGHYDRALDCFDRAVALDPHYWLAHVMAAEAKGYRGDRAEEILESLEKALAREPRHAPALALSAACLVQLGRTAEARARLDRAIEIDPTHPRVVQVRQVLG